MSDYLKEGFIDEVKGALKGEGGSGQDNVIEKIKVNGVEQAVDPNKAVDIPVPTKTSELENDEGFLTEHQDLSDYAKKADVPTVPTNVSEFTNDSDYQTSDDVSNALEPYAKSSDVATQITEGIAKVVADAPEDFDTLKEMSDWIASHENDASAMNSAIQDNKNGISELNTNMADHTGNKNNPHGVTKSDVGLGSVDNTADLDKPVSKAQATAIADAKKAGTDAQNNLTSHIGNTNNPHSVTKSQVGLGNVGNFKAVSTVASQGLSDNEKSNARTNIGLGKIDNTADLDKPISTATQTALDDINRNLVQLENDLIVNKVNPNITKKDYYIHASGDYTNYDAYDVYYAKVEPNKDYFISNLSVNGDICYAQTDINFNIIDGTKVQQWGNSYTVTTVDNAEYIAMSCYKGNIPMVSTKDGTPYNTNFVGDSDVFSENVANINESLSVIGKCKNFFKPTLGTTTKNGVTCTNNGDGTYTLNGTSSGSETTFFDFYNDFDSVPFAKGKTYKFILLDKVPRNTSIQIYVYYEDAWRNIINNIDGSFNLDVLDKYRGIIIRYLINESNLTFDNIILKPMITTNLNATYDDFVPYTGDGDTLTADVAYGMKELHESLDDYYVELDKLTALVPFSIKSGESFTISTQDGSHFTPHKIAFYDETCSEIENWDLAAYGGAKRTITYPESMATSYYVAIYGGTAQKCRVVKAKNDLSRQLSNTQYSVGALKNDLGNYAPKANPTFTGEMKVSREGIIAVNENDEPIALELQGVTIGADSDYLDAFELREGHKPLSSLYMAKSTGADYAEYFEWADKNPNDEDRVGYFVTFDENYPEKIRYAKEGDYILGIVSGMPNVIGNDDNGWSNRYILDEFGRRIEEEFEYEETVVDEETGEETTVTKTGTKWKENPDYDESKPYVPRKERPEWSAIGMLGVLSVYDDGTCKVNGYCKCSDGGIATKAENKSDGYRVIARVTDNIIKIVFR